MKKCPKCEVAYFDEMLEFCLEDGTRLAKVGSQSTIKTENFPAEQISVETQIFNDRTEIPKTVAFQQNATVNQAAEKTTEPTSLRERTVEKGYRALEIGTIVLAFAHNWWQWLYIDRRSYGGLWSLLFSGEFFVWFLLLTAGTIAGILTLKSSRRKEFGYIGLIMLAINFLLIIVPRR